MGKPIINLQMFSIAFLQLTLFSLSLSVSVSFPKRQKHFEFSYSIFNKLLSTQAIQTLGDYSLLLSASLFVCLSLSKHAPHLCWQSTGTQCLDCNRSWQKQRFPWNTFNWLTFFFFHREWSVRSFDTTANPLADRSWHSGSAEAVAVCVCMCAWMTVSALYKVGHKWGKTGETAVIHVLLSVNV